MSHLPRSLLATMAPHLFLLLLLSYLSLCHAAPFALNNYFSSDMVLQRGQQAAMWGYGEPGRTVTVQLDGGQTVASGVVSETGTWKVQLPPMQASLGHTLLVSDSNSTYMLTNVAFGDVYLCSGQSNMQVALNYSWGAAEAIAAAHRYPHLRLFSVPQLISNWTLDQGGVSYSPSSWVLPAKDTLQNPKDPRDRSSFFSATCYWTGMHLYDSLNGTIPIGLVQAPVGGTSVIAWTSNDTNLVCGPLPTPYGQDNVARNWPSVEYNAMIHPLLPMRFTAVLWYQGETDWWDADRYACAFPNLIKDWRAKFGYDDASLPWYFVLIHPYQGANPISRQSQLEALKLPNTGVANAIDLGDRYGIAGDIHPRNKTYVGERLARWLRRDIYGQQVAVEGPQLLSVTAASVGPTLTLTLQYSSDSNSDGLFALATPDCSPNATNAGRCCNQLAANSVDSLITYSYPVGTTTYTSSGGIATIDATARTITVVDKPARLPADGVLALVSYAFVDFPGCALYNQHRLPALPFRMNVTVAREVAREATVLRFNNFFSNNMVLQRGPQRAVVWGYGEPGRTVTVALDAVNLPTVTVSDSGDWSVQLPASDARLFASIYATDGTTNIQLTNVAFGDVYLCSGQSNMQVALQYSFDGAYAIADAADYQNLRLFNKPPQNNTMAQNETLVSYSPDSWAIPSNTTLQTNSDWSYFSATCYWAGMHIYDSLNGSVPIGLVQSSFGGTVAAAWTSPDTNTKCGPIVPLPAGEYEDQPFNDPSVLYNAMIYPLLPMRFRAVLWYQGESDFYDIDRYTCSFPNMIADWRAKFGYDAASLPFYFVLLSPYTGRPSLALLRQAQLSAWQPGANVGVASAIDLGDKHGSAGDIHPRNKSFVGERLARWVRRDVYKQEVAVLGPESLMASALSVVMANSNSTSPSLSVKLTFPPSDMNEGLYVLPSPDCDTCCQGGAGVLLVSINDTSSGTFAIYRPAVSIDQQARTLTANITVAAAWSNQATATVWLEAEPWPQCVLYNKHGLPALPSIITVPVGGGGGSSMLRLNNYFSSSMVLQRDQQAVVWGYGEPGHNVTVYLDGQNVATAVISTSGDWSVKLPATSSSFNRNVTVSDTVTTITLTNVAFGDVYLCSGQSNMQITMNYSFGGAEAIAAADKYPNIRLFNIGQTASNTTLDEGRISFSPNSWVYPATDSLQAPWSTEDVWSFFSATCYWTGMHIYDSLNGSVPLGLVHSSYGGTVVSAWTSPDTNTKCGPLSSPGSADYDQPSALYNAMIHPLLPMRLRAVLWYQGESDWYDIDRYKCSFPNMIADWRSKFGYDVDSLPFYFVLLSPYTGANALLRQAQLSAWHEGANVGVASAIDLGDASGSWGNIHPRNKSYVGERLARWVRRDVYKQQVAVLGPEPIGLMDSNAVRVTSASSGGTTNMTVVVTYSQTDVNEGLYVLPSPDCTTCCQNGAGVLLVTIQDSGSSSAGNATYRPAVSIDDKAHSLTASFIAPFAVSDKATATVWLEAEPWPQCVLYNKHGLPALPFVTTIPLNGGGDDSSSSMWVYAIVAVVLLVAVGVVIWLVVHYGRKRRASSDAEAVGYRGVDDRRTGLLSDSDDNSTA